MFLAVMFSLEGLVPSMWNHNGLATQVHVHVRIILILILYFGWGWRNSGTGLINQFPRTSRGCDMLLSVPYVPPKVQVPVKQYFLLPW
jgi:hypothetical protein